MKVLLGAALAGLGIIGVWSPAAAYVVTRAEAPWCAVINTGTGNVQWDCQYASFEACQPNVLAGNRGFCNLNPAYGGPVVVEKRRHKTYVRHY